MACLVQSADVGKRGWWVRVLIESGRWAKERRGGEGGSGWREQERKRSATSSTDERGRTTHLDALVMQLQQELDPRIKSLLRLIGGINVARLPTLHVPLLMIHRRINHAVPNRLGHNVLCVLLGIEGQLCRNVREGDARVGEREGAQGGFDDVVAEAEDERGG
jgi:hypothetical protein